MSRTLHSSLAARNAFEDISELAVLSTPHAPLGSFDVGEYTATANTTGAGWRAK